MPSFLGRLFGVSFRTERLIMNIIGLVNSTLDWHPLKWTNKLEEIWNLSLTQRTLILDTIGEERIKAVLSYIVIARILIAHVFTLSYVSNFYPIITWRRPNLLLPWLILSFFKNVVLEVIVIAVGLLFWYDARFSLPIFLDFVLVKVVPLVFATYNWYSNSRLYLELRRIEKIRKLRRSMRSDSNLIASRLYLKFAESKYRTRSATTLISWESYDTSDTNDTISRIIENPNLSPAQKAMRILGLREQDIEDARVRIKEREMRRKLTEEEDEKFAHSPRDMSRYFSIVNEYHLGMTTLLPPRDDPLKSSLRVEAAESRKENNERTNKSEEKFPSRQESTVTLQRGLQKNNPIAEQPYSPAKPGPSKGESVFDKDPGPPKEKGVEDSNKKWEKPNTNRVAKTEPDNSSLKEQSSGKSPMQSLDGSCSPIKPESSFNCNCIANERSLDDKNEECCMSTSTPNDSPTGNKNGSYNLGDSVCSLYETCTNDCIRINEASDVKLKDDCPLFEKLLGKDLNMFRNIRIDEKGLENKLTGECKLQSGEDTKVVVVQNLSEIVQTIAKDMASNFKILKTQGSPMEDKKVAKTVSSLKCTIDNGTTNVLENSMSPYKGDANMNALQVNVPEYSFADENIPRFYKDSMKVFDGCYEKDFATNSEVQCLLQQLEKKKWHLFPGQVKYETLLSSNLLVQNEGVTVQNLGAAYHLTTEFENVDRYEVSMSSTSKVRQTQMASKIIQVDEKLLGNTDHLLADKITHHPPTKNAYTQTSNNNQQSNSPSRTDQKKSRKHLSKRKRSKDEARIVSPSSSIYSRRSESQASFHHTTSKSSLRRRSGKHQENQRKPPPMPKSHSDRSICECKMPQGDSRNSSEYKFDRKDDRKPKFKIDNFGTIPLTQVAKPSMFDPVAYGKKPPVYPRKIKIEVSQKKISAVKKILELTGKNSEKQTSQGSRKFKWKGKVESVEEQEAREMRALKAYNEMTLMEDKKNLETRRGIPASRNSLDSTLDNTRSRGQSRKHRPKRDQLRLVELVTTDYLDKENLQADASTVIEPLLTIPFKETKVYSSDKFTNVSSNKHSCAKLSKVNKVTDKLLDNFDRLHRGQIRQDTKKSKTVETDARKQYTKYSRPKKLAEEENVSVVSMKKLEGTQKGRELERTQAREDVRNRSTVSVASSVQEEMCMLEPKENLLCILDTEDYSRMPSTSLSKRKDKGTDDLFTTIKDTVMQDVISVWSSDTLDQFSIGVDNNDDAAFSIVSQQTPRIEEEIQEEDFSLPKLPGEISPVSSTELISLKRLDSTPSLGENPDLEPELKLEEKVQLKVEENPEVGLEAKIEEKDETNHEETNLESIPSNQDVVPVRRPTNLWEFARSVETVCTHNSIIFSNPSVPRGEEVQIRNIVDDDTIRMLYHAFSDCSIYAILNLSGETPTVNMLNRGPLNMEDDEFYFQPNRESMGIAMEELPPLPHEEQDLKKQILTSIYQLRSREEENGGGVCSTSFPVSTDVAQISEHDLMEVLSIAFQYLGISDMEINEELEEEENEEEEEEEMENIRRFVKEDICLNINFPILVRESDIVDVPLDLPNDTAEEYVNPLKIELSKVNLFSMEDTYEICEEDRSEEIKKLEAKYQLQRDGQRIHSVAFSSQLMAIEDRKIERDVFEPVASSSRDTNTILQLRNVKCSGMISLEDNQPFVRIREDNEEDASIEIIDTNEVMGLKNASADREIKIYRSRGEQILEKKENESDLRTEEENEEKGSIDSSTEMSLTIIFIFWIAVFYIYIHHFYQKMLNFMHVTKSTQYLKPFEIHTAPTSTITLIENTELVERLRDKDTNREEEYDEEEDYLIDFEKETSYQSVEEFSNPELIETLLKNLDIRNEEYSREIENEVEDTMRYLNDHVAEGVKVIPFPTPKQANDYETEKFNKFNFPMNLDVKSSFHSPDRCLIIHTSLLNFKEILNETDVTGPNIIVPEIQERLRLCSTDEEVNTFLFEDDDNSTSLKSEDNEETELSTGTQSSFVHGKTEINEVDEAPELEETMEVQSTVGKTDSTVANYQQQHRVLHEGEETDKCDIGENPEEAKSKENLEEAKESTKQEENANSEYVQHTYMLSTESFDSTYTRGSLISRKSTPVDDLILSSMEEFSILSNMSSDTSSNDEND